MQKWATIKRRISPNKIPNTTKIVSLIPDCLLLKFTFGKKYLAARAPGRNMVPMNKASMNRYPKLQRQIATNRVAAIQYNMTSSRFIIDINIANKQKFCQLKPRHWGFNSRSWGFGLDGYQYYFTFAYRINRKTLLLYV